jgi:CheY-like chemotaxis protein
MNRDTPSPRDPAAATPAEARVLVASDNADDLAQIVDQLEGEFGEVRTTTDAAAAADFDAFRPHVLIVAYDAIEKADRYALALHRRSAVANEHRHRTLLLCTKDELGTAIGLCREGRFDDYVMHWPLSQDGKRLAMTTWSAARESLGLPRGAAVQRWLERAGPGDDAAAPLRIDTDATPSRARGGDKPLVMVVEDDEFSRLLIESALDGQPWEIAFAHDGTMALGLLTQRHPDLILMDINLPDMDGIALTGRLKALPQYAAVPVLMLTGDARRETLASSVNAGASGFIVKPFTRDVLIERMDRFLAIA